MNVHEFALHALIFTVAAFLGSWLGYFLEIGR